MRESTFFLTFASMDKKSLRQYIKEEKQRHTEAEQRQLDGSLCRRLLEHQRVAAAETVLLYWSLPDEVCTHALVEELAAMGKTVLLPKVVSGTEMTLHRFTSVDDMVRGAYGILEPAGAAVDIAEVAEMALPADGAGKGRRVVAVVPGVAFDAAGHRLGRGKGYYDRLLGQLPGLYTIGLCYPFQMVHKVPAELTDIQMNEVIC